MIYFLSDPCFSAEKRRLWKAKFIGAFSCDALQVSRLGDYKEPGCIVAARMYFCLMVIEGMKRWAKILATTLIVIGIVAVFIRDFIEDGAIHYFSDRPQRLLGVAAIAVVGGTLVWAFSYLPIAFCRRLELLCRYIVAVGLAYLIAWTGAFIYLCHASGQRVGWSFGWYCLFAAWTPGQSKSFIHFVLGPNGSKFLDHALLYSVIASVPLAVLGVMLVQRLGRVIQEPAKETR
ncbi:MAG TPA: hypothetical protein VGR14_03210 [Verrucomicrobiae bacterium]|nr:hypothetical protein [Verrucomicrobiae bacterium]